ncbi:MAG: glycoside hydrolase family 31 protein [Candidatus Sumerlaeaceae bacterium]|nr:glycoside hydrolase family 31 protein [Candidatus Sumerlaeaceae bacterium]
MAKSIAVYTIAGLASGGVQANPHTFGPARFTVIAPECIRIEYQPDGKFIDDSSLFAVNRSATGTSATITQNAGSQTLDTGRMKLTYTPDGKPLAASNLKVEISGTAGPVVWMPGSRQTQNLGGTINTLDQVKGPVSLEEGILSRNGWYLLDDSKGYLLKDDWVKPRPANSGTDWYLFGYGSDYAAAFRAFTTIGGKVPLPRKVALGSWYSRWWKYTTEDYKQIVREYAEHDFPLDIIVMDMEWHTKGWTGWSWNYKLLPDPPALLKWFHDQGLAVTMNVHPADGVQPKETMYAKFMRDMGEDPNSTRTIPFDAGNRKYMETLFRDTHWPLEDEGVDFWWVDWQQDREVRSLPGLLNLSWLNKLYFDNSMRQGKRGLGFSRWGGWGDHRHPIHFSGDADTGWAMLGFEVPFTSTAGNEGAYFWSHDIGGHFGQRNEEPYARWVQFATMTAAMRIHSGIIEYLDRRPWRWPKWGTESMRRAFHLRSTLIPYVYSAVRQTHESGLPLNRPMYVEYPDFPEAYECPQEFLLGHDLIAAPIASAGYGPTRVASQLVWFPPGEWRNYFTSEAVTGPQWRLVSADMNEFPLFVRAGAPIPTQPYSPRPASAKLDELVLKIWPATDEAEYATELYEDDGISRKYESGDFAKTRLTSRRKGNSWTITVEPVAGKFNGQPDKRGYQFVVAGVKEPQTVLVDGKPASVKWDAAARTASLSVEPRSPAEKVVVEFTGELEDPAFFNASELQRRLAGIVGKARAAKGLEQAIDWAAREKTELLPGLMALGGIGMVENGTHYPFVGTLTRLFRNADSTLPAKSFHVVWARTVQPRSRVVEQKEVTAILDHAPVSINTPDWKKPELDFMESSVDERIMSFEIDGRPVTYRHQLGEFYGHLENWFVSPSYPFQKNRDIASQQEAPEKLTLDRLATPETLEGWVAVKADEKGFVDLKKVHDEDYRMTYASTVVESATDRKLVLGFRSDDGIEVWLNGKKIHSRHVFRSIDHAWEEVPVLLKKGRNVLLVKVSQDVAGWGFMVSGREDVAKPKKENR